jgi:predicted aconitase with swiveling domain/8-oxo-dGTP pyrophosphatase MutT (NUDIX family)
MMLKGRGISKGEGEGTIVLSEAPVSFLGGVNPSTGQLSDPAMGSHSVKGVVFAFPRGKGSTVGSYVLLDMKRYGTLPAAMINSTAEPIVATGAVMAGVPLVDRIDLSLLRDGDRAIVDGGSGQVELPDVVEKNVVTCVVRDGDRLLVLKRSDQVGTFKERWAGVSGFVEEGETPEDTARRELREETGLSLEISKGGESPRVRTGSIVFCIHPFLFDAVRPHIEIDWEHTEYRWIRKEEVSGLLTVPGLDRVFASLGL